MELTASGKSRDYINGRLCLQGRLLLETGFSSLGRMMQNFIDLSNLYRPAAHLQFPTELDHLLLGLLDGLVCGSSVLYWQHFPWQNSTSDNSGRICIWRWLYTDQLHCARQLLYGIADDRKGGLYRQVSEKRRYVRYDRRYDQDYAWRTGRYGGCSDYDDRLLRNIL